MQLVDPYFDSWNQTQTFHDLGVPRVDLKFSMNDIGEYIKKNTILFMFYMVKGTSN